MSFPKIPNITPIISLSVEQTIPLLLSSIAFEELALAHLMNAEAEKLQFVLGTLGETGVTLSPAEVSVGDLLTIDASIQRTLRDVIKKEMLLEFKFENVLDLIGTEFGTIQPDQPDLICNERSEVAATPQGSYTLVFLGREVLPNGQAVWRYELTNNTPNDISHWTLVPCGPINVVSATVQPTGEPVTTVSATPTNNPGASIDCLPLNTFGIEISGGGVHGAGETAIYTITTSQSYPIDNIQWGAKAGLNVGCGIICGPCP